MAWSSTHITVGYQLLILAYLLPPIFIALMVLSLVVPHANTRRSSGATHEEAPPGTPSLSSAQTERFGSSLKH